MNLYRFKSNPKTIIKDIGDNMVQIVWGEYWEYGWGEAWIYRKHEDNLIPLTTEETKEVLDKIKGLSKIKK